MKQLLAFILISFASAIIYAQGNNITSNNNGEDDNKVFTKVEIETGTNPHTLAEHIKKNCQLPDSVSKTIPVGAYKIYVDFIIDVHGNIGQVKQRITPVLD